MHTRRANREVRLPNFKKKYVAGALAVGLIMGAGGIAAAYFTATATGTGNVRVGAATPFTVTQNTPLPGALYPGQHVTTSFNINNTGGGIQHYAVTVAVDHTATTTVITAFQSASRAVVPGCKARWFTTAITTGSSGTLNPGASATLGVKVTMTNGTAAGSTQNACQTTFPKLTVSSGGPAGFALFEAEGGTASWASNTKATLSIPEHSPTYKSTATADGAAAGIEVLNPPAALPATPPTFTTSAYGAGSPRWVIQFTGGAQVVGYPPQAGSAANTWGTGVIITVPYGSSWTTVKTQASGLHVKDAFIVATTGQPTPFTDAITNVHYGTASF